MSTLLRNSVILSILLFFANTANGQLVSNNAFLKGNYVEVGIAPCGSFGSSVSAPSGYHPRGSGGSSSTSQLGFVANVAKNNWSTYVGDYFLPGTPEEGWGLTVNGTSYNNNLICNSGLGANQIQGNFISYESNASQVAATWQGIVAGLSITSRTYIPVNSLFFITEVTIQNTSASRIDNIYYMRNVDPDHGVLTPGGSGNYATTNTIVTQTPNSCNQALVSAITLTGNYYLGLGSIDSRARVTHGGFSNRSALDIWNGTGFSTSGTVQADRAISVAFNIGSLNPNQSTKLAYAYILDAAQLTQALAATNINLDLDGVNFSTGNTTNVCSGTAVPITLSNTGTFTSWTWSPATGLNTTTGTSVIATLTSPITYTATGVGACGTTSVNVTLNPVIQPTPGNAGTISGLSVIALGQSSVTYSIPQVSNATYYNWTLPPGAVITSARADSNVITFNAPNTTWCGTVSVQPKNSCGSGTASSMSVCISNIATGSLSSPLCSGATTNLPISTPLGFFLNGNVFTAQLSDANGNFSNPVNIGTLTSTSSGFINITIPVNSVGGTHYRVRTISSNPATIGTDNGSDLVINEAQTPSIQINANQTHLCAGTTITFTASISAGGTSPVYQWKKNGTNVGSNSSAYTDNSFVTGDQISCTLTSNATCATTTTANSNVLTISNSTGTPAISISANKVSICSGTLVTFTAVATNGGTSPVYQWRKNGTNVGTNANTYAVSDLITTDVITCVLTSNANCITSTTATSNSVSVNVTLNVTPSVSIAASQTSVCSGANTTITFTATPVNGGSNPIYQWRKNGVNIGNNSATYSTNTLGASDVITCVLTSNATCLTVATATSNAISITITPSVTPEITVAATQTAICTGGSPTITFTASIVEGGSAPVYQWKKNGINVGSNSSVYSDNSFTNGTQITCTLTSNSNAVCLTTDTVTSVPITITISSPVTPFVSISSSAATICAGAAVTFTATPVNGGTAPSYQWRKNGINVGTDASTYVDNTLVTGDQISCIMTSNLPCLTAPTATSSSLTVTVNPSVVPSVVISASQTVICTGTTPTIIFRATPVNGGTATYQWRRNGTLILTTPSTAFPTSAVTAGDIFTCTMFSTAVCAVPSSVVSNSLTITSAGTATPTLSITASRNSICSGNQVIFSAVSNNGGSTPTYQWFRNGTLVQSSTSLTYLTSALVNGDVITCTMTSTLACASPTIVNSSNSISIPVTTSITPSVTIVASQTSICTGTSVTFTATPINGGTNPTYQWYKNSSLVGTNSPTYTDNTLTNGSYVYCYIYNYTSPCLTTTSAVSNLVTMTVSSALTPSISVSTSSSTICSGTSAVFTAFISNGGTSPVYQWKKNGINVGTNSSTYTDNTLVNGDYISCSLTSNASCLTTATANSNNVVMAVTTPTPLSVNITASQSVICTGTSLPTITFTATPNNTTAYKYYNWRKNGVIVSTNYSYGSVSYSTSSVVAGDIFTCEIFGSDVTCVAPAFPILSNTIQLTSSTSVTPSISISAATSTSICNGGYVTFTANSTNGGSIPLYQWKKNGITVVSTNSPSYSLYGLANNDIVTCTMTSNLTCAAGGPVTSNGISVLVSPIVIPSVSIVASQTNVCAGTSITFTATPINGGAAPNYNWTKNGTSVLSSTSNTYTSNNFTTGDIVACTLISNASCISTTTANSNTISLIVTGTIPTIAISTPSTSLCAGSNSATFTAAVLNAGTNPTYQWKKNGVNVGTNSSTYTDNAIANNDTVICLLTSDVACPATVTSNKLGMRITTVLPPVVSTPVNINCGQTAILTATPSGSSSIRWFTSSSGGTSVGTGNIFSATPLLSSTYYAEAFSGSTGSRVNSINTSGAIGVDAYSFAGGIGAGIAISPNYVFMTGSSYTARFSKTGLTGGTALPVRTKYFSDLSNGDLWQLGDNVSNGGNFASGTATRIYKLDENLNATGIYLPLSTSFTVNFYYSIIAAGEGYAIVFDYNSGTARHINLTTGTVTVLTTTLNSLSFNITNGTAYGWSEFDGTNYYMFYRLYNDIYKVNLNTGVANIFQTFTNLASDLTNILVDHTTSRFYFYHSGSSQFLSGYTTALGYVGINNIIGSASCTSSRVAVNVNVTPTTPTITASGSTTICSTGSLTLTATAGSSYQWTKNGNNIVGAVSQTYNPTETGNYAVYVTTSAGCVGLSTATSVTVSSPVTPTLAITANQTTICSGTTITFTASPVNGGTTPAYQWKKNGTNVGTNSSTYSDNSFVNGDIISCVLTSNQTCVTSSNATSNSITLTVSSATPSISITATQTNICAGIGVAFTATPVNGGLAPVFQWRKNGTNVGTNSATYSDNGLVNGDIITCVLTSNATCASTTPVTSNSITINVTSVSTPTISIAASQTSICAGTSITFTATALAGGSSPIYQWKKNGTNVGTNSATFTSSTLANNDVITCQLTSNLSCVTSSIATSNSVTVTVNANVTPTISITSTQTNICTGTSVTFTATATNKGTTPVYQWRKNGANVGTNSPTYTDNALTNGNQITCVLTSNATCATSTSVTSNIITVTVNAIVTPSVTISSTSTTICSGSYVNLTAIAVNGGTSPIYEWFKNGITTGFTGSSISYNNFINGDVITCKLTSNASCVSSAIVTSNSLTFTVSPSVTPSVVLSASQLSICSGTSVVLTANATNVGSSPTYSWNKNGNYLTSTTTPTYTATSILNGDVFSCTITGITAVCANSSVAYSNSVTINVIAKPTVSVNTPTAILCNGTSTALFTATVSNAGITPSYQWKKNGSNVGTNTSTYTDNSLANNDSVWCVLTSSGTCTEVIPSNKVTITTITVTNPVVTSPINIVCSDTATLAATVAVGNQVRWFTTASGGSAVGIGNNFKVTPNINTTYYAEAYPLSGSKMVATIATTGSVVIDHNSITGDDRGGIAVSPNYVYVVGDNYTGRYLKSDLSSGVSLALRDGFFSNIANGDLWQLGTALSNGSFYGGTISHLYRLNEDLTPTGVSLALSQSITMNSGIIAGGDGFVVLYANGSTAYHINLTSGLVTVLSTSLSLSYVGSESWVSYGWAEYDGNNYYIAYRSSDIVRTNLTTGVTNTIQTFTNLSDMANVIFDAQNNRLYFHYEGSGQFGGSSETLGYLSVTASNSAGTCLSSRVPLVVNVSVAPAPIITASGSTTICSTGSLTLTSSSGVLYQWIKNGVNISGAASQTFSPTESGNYSVSVTNSNGCVSVSAATTVTVNNPVTPTVSITANQTTICSSTPITFTATIANGGSTPVYQWRKNGNNVGTNSSTYTDNTLLSGDIVTCQLTSNAQCTSTSSVLSNSLVITVSSAVPSISISATQTAICAGSSVMFTATPVNGGITPVYQWRKNGNNVGTNSLTYTDNSLVNNDVITCQLTSNATCATTSIVSSNSITMQVNAVVTPTVSVAASTTNICAGSTVTFTATGVNAGTGPIYQWKKNGNNVGTNSTIYTESTLNNGDIITCQLNSNAQCATSSIVLSNAVTMTVNAAVIPSINISTTSTSICSGTGLSFTASTVNAGTSPTYVWRKNGIIVGSNSATYIDNGLVNGNTITCQLTSNASCATPVTVLSNTLTITVNATATPSISIFASSNPICSGNSVTFSSSVANGGTLPVYQWKKNGVNVGANASSYTANNLVTGDIISCVLQSNRTCLTTSTVNSNQITMTVNTTVTPSVTASTSLSSICSGTSVTLTATPVNGGASPYYYWYANSSYLGTSYTSSFTTSAITSNSNVYCVLNSNASCVSTSSVNSNNLTISVTPSVLPTVTIYTPTTSIVTGTSVSFTAIPTNGGSAPTYQWKKNGVNTGTNSNTYTSNTLAHNDVITCVVTSNANCASPATATSNGVTMTVISNYLVRGNVVTPNNLPIPGATVLVNSTPADSVLSNSATGAYSFNLAPLNNYTISAKKNNDIVKASGVNIFDVLLTQNHILGTTPFNSPYKIIAADVNNDGNVNIFDVLFIKRLILGVDTTFAGKRLWAFVDSVYTFASPSAPFPYTATRNISSLSSNLNNQSFVGVKLGDVNFSLVPAVGTNREEPVNRTPVQLYYDTIYCSEKTDKIRVRLKTKNFTEIRGMQFTLNFNSNSLEFDSIEDKALQMDYGKWKANEGVLTFIWNDLNANPLSLPDGTFAFDLIFNKKKTNLLTEDINITSDFTSAVAYDKKYESHAVTKGRGIIMGNLSINESITLVPNPTNGWLKVIMMSSENKPVSLVLLDNTGRKVLEKRIDAVIGKNELMFNVHEKRKLMQGAYYINAVGLKGNPSEKLIIIN